jgi:hypothetical protein
MAESYAHKRTLRVCLLGWKRIADTTWRKIQKKSMKAELDKVLADMSAEYEVKLEQVCVFM